MTNNDTSYLGYRFGLFQVYPANFHHVGNDRSRAVQRVVPVDEHNGRVANDVADVRRVRPEVLAQQPVGGPLAQVLPSQFEEDVVRGVRHALHEVHRAGRPGDDRRDVRRVVRAAHAVVAPGQMGAGHDRQHGRSEVVRETHVAVGSEDLGEHLRTRTETRK